MRTFLFLFFLLIPTVGFARDVTLTWQNPNNIPGYVVIEISGQGSAGPFKFVDVSPQGSLSYIHSNIPSGNFCYRVWFKVYEFDGPPYSNVACTDESPPLPTTPGTPSNLQITPND